MTASRTTASRHAPWGGVIALGLTQITSWGSLYYLFALLMQPLQRELQIDKTWIVGAFSVALLLSGLQAPKVGAWIDRHGGRAPMVAGSLLAVAGLLLLSQVGSAWQLYAVWALLGVAMAMTLYEPAFAVITRAFPRDYRKAITVLTLFGGLASTVFWPLTQALIDGLGWRHAVQVLAAINLLVCVPLHLWLLPGAQPAPQRPVGASAGGASAASAVRSHSLAEVLRDPRFHLLAAAFTANVLVFSALAVHLIAMLQTKGMSAAEAAALGAMIGPMQVLGRLLEISIGRRFSAQAVGVVAMSLLPLSLLLLALFDLPAAGFLLFALLYGTGNGVMTIVRGALPADLWGAANYGAVNGALAAPALIAKAAGPLVAALVFSATGSYGWVLAILIATGTLAVALLLVAIRWRRHVRR
jgi:MFS family permease